MRSSSCCPTIVFSRPSQTISVSTTGADCSLGCAHCNGHYLRAMRPVEVMLDHLRAGDAPSSILLSGGCTPGGKVPMDDWPARLKAAAPTGTKFNCHAGLVTPQEAEAIASWADVVSFDIVADAHIIEEVYGLDRAVHDYVTSYTALASKVPTVPHVCIGLGREVGPAERAAMELLRDAALAGLVPPALVFIAFIPTRGTRFGNRPAPTPAQVAQVLREARTMFPGTPIHLGCMRPGGAWRQEADVLAIDAGVDLIVRPAPAAVEHARDLGIRIVVGDECCVFAPSEPPATRTVRVSAGTACALGLKSIAVTDAPTTAYVMVGERCVRDCSFCAQARTSTSPNDRLSRITWPEFDSHKLAAALRKSAANGTMARACVQVVGAVDAHARAVEAVRFLADATGGKLPVSVSYSASSRPDQVDELIAAGADKVALPIDACNPELHRKIKGRAMKCAIDLISHCSSAHPGRISTHLIAGLGETEEDLLRLAAQMLRMGVTVGLFAFTPIPGTRMADAIPPAMDSYRRLQLGIWALRNGHGIDEFEFREGRLSVLRVDWGELELTQLGIAFQTSGCPGCNRPYYNERPGRLPYNYPRPLTAAETTDALAASGLLAPEEAEALD